MIADACFCSEDLKNEISDFAYYGLRAEHNDLVHKVEDLESAQKGMSEKEKESFKILQEFQVNRQGLVDKLDKLESLFKPVCHSLICQCEDQKSRQIWLSFYGRGAILTYHNSIIVSLILISKIAA